MRRREFISLLGGAAAAWPLAAQAQSALPIIGWLNGGSADGYADRRSAFLQGLSEAAFAEGRNAVLEYRWAEGEYGRLPELAADLVRRAPAVIVAGGTAAAPLVAKAATRTIPIVFAFGSDPVALGLVSSLSRPGGNITGVTTLGVEILPKKLELLGELIPRARTFGLLVNPANQSSKIQYGDLQEAARTRGLQLQILNASTERELISMFESAVWRVLQGLVIVPDAFFNSNSELLATLASRHAIPAISSTRAFVTAGGLAAYGNNQTDLYREAAIYVGRILKGERPADLPVQQATRVELIVNLKAAKALGLAIPLPLLGRADEVIE